MNSVNKVLASLIPNVFFACAVGGERNEELIKTLEEVIEKIENQGWFKIISKHNFKGTKCEHSMSESEIWYRDFQEWQGAFAAICECSGASTGVGYEICDFLESQSILVLCLIEESHINKASVTVKGNPNIIVQYYNKDNLEKIILNFAKLITAQLLTREAIDSLCDSLPTLQRIQEIKKIRRIFMDTLY